MSDLVGRGNLNSLYNLLILNEYIGFVFSFGMPFGMPTELLGTRRAS